MKISDIDKNFEVKTNIGEQDIRWLDAAESCFRLHGITPPDETDEWYHRVPHGLAQQTNEGVALLNDDSAGGRIRFVTDSRYVAIHTQQLFCGFPHMPLTGTSSFDLYVGTGGQRERFVGTFIPPFDAKDGHEGIFYLPAGMKQVLIHFPLYCHVKEVKIGLAADSVAEPAPDYRTPLPVVTYGSSITQGGCASHPGNSYQAILSRRLDCEHFNAGYSGSARGEQCMAEYFAGLPMSVFILDYDHNAPTPEHLQKTHKPFFDTVRKANPDLPIILLNRPMFQPNEDEITRTEIIKATYQAAIAAGDKNVWFIDFNHIFDGGVEDCWTVDHCHPADAGFVGMADALEPLLREILYPGEAEAAE